MHRASRYAIFPTVLAALVVPAPAAGAAQPAAPAATPHYLGTRYDLGTATPIDGAEPGVDQLARDITASTDATLRDLGRERATLPYSAPDESRPSDPPRVVTYPRPDSEPASTEYSATIWQLGRAHDPVVYTRAARRPGNRELDTSWTSFSFNRTVIMAVRDRTSGASADTGCIVRPTSSGVRSLFVGGTCYFALTQPANLSVEFTPQTGPVVTHPMLVFANPLERDVPSPTDPNVLYLGPGVHHLGSDVQLHSGETVYLAGGAWVEGAFHGLDVQNVVIKGRGIIDGLFMDTGNQQQNKQQPGLIDILCNSGGDPARTCATSPTSRNVLIDGITLIDGPRFNVRALSEYTTIRNVKMIGWWINTDGIVAGEKSLVEDNFVKVNEDSIKLFWGDSVVRHNVVWQLENGAPFMLSWNIEQDSSNFRVYDDDVIHVEQYAATTQGVFDARHAGKGHLQRYLFDDIRIEDATWRLFYLNVEHNAWYDPTLGYGQFSDLIFRNISAPAASTFQLPSVINGIDPEHGFSNVNLINVRLGGTCLSTAADGNLHLDPDATRQVRVMQTASCGGRA